MPTSAGNVLLFSFKNVLLSCSFSCWSSDFHCERQPADGGQFSMYMLTQLSQRHAHICTSIHTHTCCSAFCLLTCWPSGEVRKHMWRDWFPLFNNVPLKELRRYCGLVVKLRCFVDPLTHISHGYNLCFCHRVICQLIWYLLALKCQKIVNSEGKHFHYNFS